MIVKFLFFDYLLMGFFLKKKKRKKREDKVKRIVEIRGLIRGVSI